MAVARYLSGAPAVVKYSIVVSAVLLLTVAGHHLVIARVPALRFLFNGRLPGQPSAILQWFRPGAARPAVSERI
jgi:hypothetical protein